MSLSSLRPFARSLRYRIDRLRAKFSYSSLAEGNIDGFTFNRSSEDVPHVLFVTSNGAGMGHITRCLAIASAGGERIRSSFVTLSTSASVVGAQGYEYLYFQSAGKTGLAARRWNNLFYQFMSKILRKNNFDAIVFDGTWIYRGLEDALKSDSGTKMIWLRRGLWKIGSQNDQLARMEALAEGIIAPWDVGSAYENGPLKGRTAATTVKAIVYSPATIPFERADALAALGLESNRRFALIQLGAGNINDVTEVRRQVIAEISASAGESIVPVLAISPLSNEQVDIDGIRILRRYPLAQYLKAFDFVVTAGGYNSVHEVVRWNIPALIIPNLDASTDDQNARALGASKLPHCFKASTKSEIRDSIRQLARMTAQFEAELPYALDQSSTVATVKIDSGEDAAETILNMIQADRRS